MHEGSTLKTAYLDFVLHNTKDKLGEYVADTSEMPGGKVEDYKKTIPIGINYIKNFDVNISTVVVDGNKAQMKALRELFFCYNPHLYDTRMDARTAYPIYSFLLVLLY